MPKASHRETILTEGLKVVHARGFGGASVRDIVQAAGVPQGSFTNHFASKEAFGLEVLDLYFESSRKLMRETLLNESLPPLERLRSYVDVNIGRLGKDKMKNGCMLGNFSAEASDHSEPIRERLVEIFAEIQRAVRQCLKAAAKTGELPLGVDTDAMATFVVGSLQGAILLSKAQRSAVPVERFREVLFASVLRAAPKAVPKGRKAATSS